MRSSWRWLEVTLGVCFFVFVAVGIYFGGIFLRIEYWCPKLEVKPYTESTHFEYNLETDYTIAEIKQLIDKDFGVQYFYKVAKIPAGGMTYFQFRLIKINTTTILDKSYYAYAMAHELTHLKYYNGNECWTEFNAWKYLYESNDTFLHNVALWRANYITQSSVGDAYDCGYWINEYLRSENL